MYVKPRHCHSHSGFLNVWLGQELYENNIEHCCYLFVLVINIETKVTSVEMLKQSCYAEAEGLRDYKQDLELRISRILSM